MKRVFAGLLMLAFFELAGASPLPAQESGEELAKKLANPISSLISLPLQLNYDENFGPGDEGDKLLLNVQPVIPFALNEKWNLISRTIVPLVDQQDLFPGAGGQSGLGDVVQSLFFSPAAPTRRGVIWGVGPVFLLPTGSDDLLGAEKWGVGPTFVALKQIGPRTVGVLANHIESVAGSDRRQDVSASFFQPFLSRTTPKLWTYGVNVEATYNWKSEQWSVPLNLTATKLTKWEKQLVSVGGGVRYWVETPDSGPEGVGVRLLLTFLFPK
ncbi:MAG: transporter [bacterium]|nr:transporter [bacterium]